MAFTASIFDKLLIPGKLIITDKLINIGKLIITDKLINIGKLIITEISPWRFSIPNFTLFGQGMEITGTNVFMT